MQTARLAYALAALLAAIPTASAEVLWEWPYDPGSASNSMPASYGTFRMADDFVLGSEATVTDIELYGLYISGTPGDDFVVSVYEDDSGLPGALLIERTCPAVNTTTGDTWGYYNYPIYLTALELEPGPVLEAGTYWLCAWYTGDRWYWFADEENGNSCRDEGSGWGPFGTYQLVFSVLGEEGFALEQSTFGAIKSMW